MDEELRNKLREIEDKVKKIERLVDIDNGLATVSSIKELKIYMRDFERRLSRVEEALYGNSSDAGILTRLTRVEERVKNIESKIGLNLTLTVGTFLSIIVTIVALIVK
jgi:hypothetical protein